jgi:hypothetical protein
MATLLEFASRASGASSTVNSFIGSALQIEVLQSKGAMIVVGLALFIFVIVISVQSFGFESATNILRQESKAADSWSKYESTPRDSLKTTLYKLQQNSGEAKDSFLTSNFYWYTANMGGMFASNGSRPVVSPKAIRLALLGGARCFVLDIWPDLTPGDGQYAPIVQHVAAGSAWKRDSMNAVPLAAILALLVQEAYGVQRESTNTDPLMLYLRFKGYPRKSTFDFTAKVLESTIQPYRLDASYNRCRGQALIPIQNIAMFSKQIIVAANVIAADSVLGDYINIGPLTGATLEYDPNFSKQLPSEAGAASGMKLSAINAIKQNISFVAPDDAGNSWDIAGCASVGVHCLAFNFGTLAIPKDAPTYSPKAGLPMSFENASFILKPVPLRIVPSTIPAPPLPPDFKFNGGNITQPSALSTPGY